MTKNISYKRYSDRNDVFYKLGDRTSPIGETSMARCGCGNRFKVNEKETICSSCGNIIEMNMAVNLELNMKDYVYYNATTSMFVDRVEKEKGSETIATVSCMLLSLRRLSGEYYPTIGEHSLRLKIRYNITKKTALLYLQKKDIKDELAWERARLGLPYINFTQPTLEYFSEEWDIKLPEELVADLISLMGVESCEDTKSLDIYSLAWLNRTRNTDEARIQRQILTVLNSQAIRNENVEGEEGLYFRKNVNRVKRYLASNHKPKKYDENIFEALCSSYKIDRALIPKDLEKYYYLNPYSIKYAKEHDMFFKNRDVRINAISASVEKGTNIHYRCINVDDVFDLREKPQYEVVDYRKKAMNVFSSEVNIYNKIKSSSDYLLFRDTTNMIDELSINGYKVKTKGKLYDVHERASRLMRFTKAPNLTFLNAIDKEVEEIDGLIFKFVKTPGELIKLGDETQTCVGSYYNYCINGSTSIVSIERKGKFVGVLEFSDERFGYYGLSQAKGFANSSLSRKIQKSVCKFSLKHNMPISTRDILAPLSSKHNEKFKKEQNNINVNNYYGQCVEGTPIAV